MKLQTEAQVKAAENTLLLNWLIVFGAMLFSVLTVTPLVERITPAEWDWTAPILPIVVDAAVVIVVRLDSIIARLGGTPTGWSTALRWMTGCMTLALNVGDSALKGELVGVAVHSVAPLLLILSAEAGLAYRRAITNALERIQRERAAEQAERERQRAAREQQQREAREREQARREQLERERREQAARAEREEREHAARMLREQREHEARLERERAEREEARRQAELEREAAREQQQREDRQRLEQLEQQARERRERERQAAREQQPRTVHERREQAPAKRREQPATKPVNTDKAKPVNTDKAKPVNTDKLPEADALNIIRAALNTDRTIRELAAETGWSIGWVTGRMSELRTEAALKGREPVAV